jgi:hypothetical protein
MVREKYQMKKWRIGNVTDRFASNRKEKHEIFSESNYIWK